MQLSLPHPCLWTLLLLLMLGKDVASLPMCTWSNGHCFAPLEEMLDRAVSLSEQISKLSFEMFTEFDHQYSQSHQLINRNLKKCHTSSLDLPKPRRKALQTHPVLLLKLVESLLGAWKVPLYHLVKEMHSLKDAPASIFHKAREIEEKNTGLLEGVRRILNQIERKYEGNENYPAWSGLASLQSDSEDVRHFAFYNLIRCAGRNAQKVETSLRIIKCIILQKNNC